jgi:hypothetical protein
VTPLIACSSHTTWPDAVVVAVLLVGILAFGGWIAWLVSRD